MYVTESDINTLLGISGETTLVNSLIAGAESIFNTLVGADSTNGLISSSYTDIFREDDFKDYTKRGRVFFLKNKNPTAITSVNGVSAGSLNVDFILEWQRLEFDKSKDPSTSFPYGWKVAYTAGYASNAIPDDIKVAVKYLVAGLYNRKNSEGFDSFRQDLLSVNFKSDNILDTLLSPENYSFITSVVRKYSVPFVIS